MPGLLPALAAVAAWIDVRPARRRGAMAALALGFAISASTILVPTQAQQLDQPPPAVGPGVIRQIDLIGPTLSYTAHHTLTPAPADRRPGAHGRFLSRWQVGVAREIGLSGLVAAQVLSVVLGALLLLTASRLIYVCHGGRPRAGNPPPIRPGSRLAQ